MILGDAAVAAQTGLNCFVSSSVSDPKAQYIGTEPWKPKETLEEGGDISDKADIYAYGLTLWEMMTLAMPHLEMLEDDDDEEEDEGETLSSFSLISKVVFALIISSLSKRQTRCFYFLFPGRIINE